MEQANGNALVRFGATFEGASIAVIEMSGGPVWLAQQVAVPLGYSETRGFLNKLGDWGLVEGRHTIKVVGAELAALKAAMPSEIDSRAPSVVLLTEAGLYRALMRSRAPRAEEFQEWLATELLPQLRRTGRYELVPVAPAAPARVDMLVDLHKRLRLSDADLVAEMTDHELANLPQEALPGLLRRLAAKAAPSLLAIPAGPPRPLVEHASHHGSPLIAIRKARNVTQTQAAQYAGYRNGSSWADWEHFHQPVIGRLVRALQTMRITAAEEAKVYAWLFHLDRALAQAWIAAWGAQ